MTDEMRAKIDEIKAELLPTGKLGKYGATIISESEDARESYPNIYTLIVDATDQRQKVRRVDIGVRADGTNYMREVKR